MEIHSPPPQQQTLLGASMLNLLGGDRVAGEDRTAAMTTEQHQQQLSETVATPTPPAAFPIPQQLHSPFNNDILIHHQHDDQHYQQSPPCCLLLSSTTSSSTSGYGCRGTSTNNRTTTNISAPRSILLQGPRKSGKTSIAMDLAYSRAKGGLESIIYRKSSFDDSNTTEHGGGCDIEDDGDDDFPLKCLVKKEERHDGDNCFESKMDFKTRYQQIDKEKSDLGRLDGYDDDAYYDDEWDPHVLQMIRIRYVKSIREVIADLLALPMMKQQQQDHLSLPHIGAIIIDDIDRIATSNQQQAPNHIFTTASIMQLLAVAVDTSRAISLVNGTMSSPCLFPIVLATSTLDNTSTTTTTTTTKNNNVMTTAASPPWMELILTIRPASEKQIQWTAAPELLTISQWQVEITKDTIGLNNNKGKICTEYIVATSPSRGPRIHWQKKTILMN